MPPINGLVGVQELFERATQALTVNSGGVLAGAN
jgi:hypothetical protein